jgi:hypothetical protein
MIQCLLDINAETAIRSDRDYQFALVMQRRRHGRVGHDNGRIRRRVADHDGIGRFLEEEGRFDVRIAPHLQCVFAIVASHAVYAPYRELAVAPRPRAPRDAYAGDALAFDGRSYGGTGGDDAGPGATDKYRDGRARYIEQ